MTKQSWAKKEFDRVCFEKGLTKVQASKKLFGVSSQYLHMVLQHEKPCPYSLVKKLARVFGKDKVAVGLVFGYYPDRWTNYCRTKPESAIMYIEHVLAGSRPVNSL